MATSDGGKLAHLGLLPIEIASQVLASGILSMRDIVRSSRACRAWHSLCSNESILQRAAYTWGYIDDLTVSLAEHVASIKDDEQGYFKYCSSSWKKYCTACHCLEEQITGNHYSAPIGLRPQVGQQVGYPKLSYDFAAAQSEKPEDEVYQDVWRIAIDPDEQTLISTGVNGGVRVIDLETKDLLWSIPASQTKREPSLEADQGYIMWDLDLQALEAGSIARITVYKSERLCSDMAEPRRGHYRHYWTFDHESQIRTFRFKFPVLGIVDHRNDLVFWNVITKERISRFRCNNTSTPFKLEFDDEFAFVLGVGNAHVHVWERVTGKHVWAMSAGQVPVLMRPNYNLINDVEGVSVMQCDKIDAVKSDSRAGIAFHLPVTIDANARDYYRQRRPSHIHEAWTEEWYSPTRDDSIFPWLGIRVCEETNTLLFCTLLQIVILKDYNRFFKNQPNEPEFFVAIQIPDDLPGSDPVLDDHFDREPLSVSLSVCAGRALWAGWGNFIVDFKEAQSAHEVKITQLVERHCRDWWCGCYPDFTCPDTSLHASEDMTSDPVKEMLTRQRDRTHYLHKRGRYSSAILTRTAGFVIEHQALKDTENVGGTAPIQLKGRSGDKPWSDYFITCIRCWDFARSALYEFDRNSCQKQVSRLKDFAITEKKLRQWSEHAVLRFVRAGMSVHDLDIYLEEWKILLKDKRIDSDDWSDSNRSGDE